MEDELKTPREIEEVHNRLRGEPYLNDSEISLDDTTSSTSSDEETINLGNALQCKIDEELVSNMTEDELHHFKKWETCLQNIADQDIPFEMFSHVFGIYSAMADTEFKSRIIQKMSDCAWDTSGEPQSFYNNFDKIYQFWRQWTVVNSGRYTFRDKVSTIVGAVRSEIIVDEVKAYCNAHPDFLKNEIRKELRINQIILILKCRLAGKLGLLTTVPCVHLSKNCSVYLDRSGMSVEELASNILERTREKVLANDFFTAAVASDSNVQSVSSPERVYDAMLIHGIDDSYKP